MVDRPNTPKLSPARNPSAARPSCSCPTSGPRSPIVRSRYIGVTPRIANTGRPATCASTEPSATTEPTRGGLAVTIGCAPGTFTEPKPTPRTLAAAITPRTIRVCDRRRSTTVAVRTVRGAGLYRFSIAAGEVACVPAQYAPATSSAPAAASASQNRRPARGLDLSHSRLPGDTGTGTPPSGTGMPGSIGVSSSMPLPSAGRLARHAQCFGHFQGPGEDLGDPGQVPRQGFAHVAGVGVLQRPDRRHQPRGCGALVIGHRRLDLQVPQRGRRPRVDPAGEAVPQVLGVGILVAAPGHAGRPPGDDRGVRGIRGDGVLKLTCQIRQASRRQNAVGGRP